MLGMQERQARKKWQSGFGGRRIGRVLFVEREMVRLKLSAGQQRRRPRRWLTVAVIVIVNLWWGAAPQPNVIEDAT